MAALKGFQEVCKTVQRIGKSNRNVKFLLKTNFSRHVHTGRIQSHRLFGNTTAALFTVGGGLFGIYLFNVHNQKKEKYLLKAETANQKIEEVKVMSRREKRFHDFASAEYNRQVVMTPQDFIESLMENEPKMSRSSKIRLTQKDIKQMVKETRGIRHGSDTFFRDLQNVGIITYSEYLFLVTILTKSTAGLKTALKMMDVNGDQIITADEFEKIVSMINKSASKNTRTNTDEKSKMNHTTLLIHLFGVHGNDVVTFEKFFKFMDDFHSEVLELEFHEYSKSLKRISEVDFGKILLRNTTLTEQEYFEYIQRLKTRIEHPKGITLEQFKSFHTFLSNIEDFIITVNMTTVLNQPIDKDLFTRSIKVTTGADIDPYVIDVIFKLFDQDGDGKLSQNEFIGIMKDRLKRGFGKFPNIKGFQGFKRCLQKEMTRSD